MWKLNDLKNIEADDLLEHLGLQRKRTAGDWLLPGLGLFGVGVLVGAGLGLLLAPKSGADLRQDLRGRLQGGDGQTGTFAAQGTISDRQPRSM